ncbi:MAG: cupin domain-containing protein [Oligoflexales bacterium]|nr:cupin domain-containing protein [Oligoflexales bacterium]
MATLEFGATSYQDPAEITKVLADEGIIYERWGTRPESCSDDSKVLEAYAPEVARLKEQGRYVHADLVALSPNTPGLDDICEKFVKEHHHDDDEVRFVVEGAGVFEVMSQKGDAMFKISTEPGDLVVIPAKRRHLFYLTEKKAIRCIRLFKDSKGWEAIYSRP